MRLLAPAIAFSALIALGLTAPSTAHAVDPTSYDGPHVTYRTADGHVHVLTAPRAWLLGTGSYVDQDATTSAHTSAKAVGTPWGWVGGGEEHVVYRSANGHLNELWRTVGTGSWVHTDLTTAAHTSARAAGDAVGWDDSARRVAYRGTDGHLHELVWNGTTRLWHDRDVTAATHVKRKDAADPRWDAGSALLTYRTVDDHVHVVRFDGSTLADVDVWKLAKSKVKARGRPTVYVSRSPSTINHVLFRGLDGHVHELGVNGALTKAYDHDLSKLGRATVKDSSDPIGWAVLFEGFIPTLVVRYLDTSSRYAGMSRGLGSEDPDRGPASPTPWFAWNGGRHLHSMSPVTAEDLADNQGFASVTPGGHVVLWYVPGDGDMEMDTDLTAAAHTPLARGGATVYLTQADPG